jgi:hypothetical protein
MIILALRRISITRPNNDPATSGPTSQITSTYRHVCLMTCSNDKY